MYVMYIRGEFTEGLFRALHLYQTVLTNLSIWRIIASKFLDRQLMYSLYIRVVFREAYPFFHLNQTV